MLGIMRKYKQSIIIKGVFAIIVLSFIGTIFLIWGEGEKGLEGSDFAVKIDRTKISHEDFRDAYSRLRSMYQQLSPQPLTPELEKQLGLKKLALENLINTALVRNEARRMGIEVTKDEIVNAVAAIPAFQKDGAFNMQLYQQLLQANHLTPEAFEASQKEDILIRKARQKITDQVKVSDAEALQLYRKQHDKVNLLCVSFSPADVRSEVRLSEQDLNGYLQRNQERFRVPEQVGISYVLLKPERVMAGLAVDNGEVETFYRKNIDLYQEKGSILPLDVVRERVKADALRFKAGKRAYEMAADALNRNLKAADLKGAAVALGVQVEKTATFTLAQPPAAVAGETALIQKAFALKKGELGGPVETKRGVYLLRVDEKIPSAVPPLERIRGRVEALAAAEKAGELARKKAEEALARMAQGKDEPKARESGSFSYNATGDIPGIGKSRELMEAAFGLAQGSPTPKVPFLVGERWYAVRLKGRIEADTANFQKTKEQIKTGMLPERQQAAVESWMKGLKAKAKIEVNPALLAD